MKKETEKTLSEFSQKALQRLRDRKVVKTQRLYIPSMDDEIVIRNLTREEIIECIAIEDTEADNNRSDRYTVYLAVKEPNLKELAKLAMEEGEIKEYMDIVQIFDLHELVTIAQKIMQLSGVLATRQVSVVEELKN